ncbi:MAG: hypothetical protein KDA90_21160 [Planctomycetaceae bacterium]|nr:hypothetical protein [Planctomycetaceae bacterium]
MTASPLVEFRLAMTNRFSATTDRRADAAILEPGQTGSMMAAFFVPEGATHMDTQELDRIPLSKAAKRIGVHTDTLRRRLEGSDVTLFEDPRDLRRKLVRLDDLDRIFATRPIDRKLG